MFFNHLNYGILFKVILMAFLGGVGVWFFPSVCSELFNEMNCTENLAGDKDIPKVSSVFVTVLS